MVQERERDVGGDDDDTGLELHEETGELGAEFNKKYEHLYIHSVRYTMK
jgi:hypothetical protein